MFINGDSPGVPDHGTVERAAVNKVLIGGQLVAHETSREATAQVMSDNAALHPNPSAFGGATRESESSSVPSTTPYYASSEGYPLPTSPSMASAIAKFHEYGEFVRRNSMQSDNVCESNVSPDPVRSRIKLKLRLRLENKQEGPEVLPQMKLKLENEENEQKVFPQIDGDEGSPTDAIMLDEDDMDSKIEPVPTRCTKSAITRARPVQKEPTHRDESSDNDIAAIDAQNHHDQPLPSIEQQTPLMMPPLKRSDRILDTLIPKHRRLIANATKVGPEYYDSDEDQDLPGDAKDTTKPHLFRNVKWGTYAVDFSNDAEFTTQPQFTQFVPGRFELQPDGTVADQKAKLVIKLIDKAGRKRIFTNPPPKDWNNQQALSALNKRTVQQIRRNTPVRFREVVQAYAQEERRWILANLTHAKPTNGWKDFVRRFNERFEGKCIPGVQGPRPFRSLSSLTKEIERFGPVYVKGLVPRPTSRTS